MADTGNTASLVMTTTGVPGCISSLSLPTIAIDALDVSCIDTTDFKHMVATDLADPGEMTLEVFFDGLGAMPVPSGAAVHELITVTFPLTPGGTTSATLAGSGFLKSVGMPTLKNGELQTQTLTFQFDGGYDGAGAYATPTIPTWVAGT